MTYVEEVAFGGVSVCIDRPNYNSNDVLTYITFMTRLGGQKIRATKSRVQTYRNPKWRCVFAVVASVMKLTNRLQPKEKAMRITDLWHETNLVYFEIQETEV
jgi:hypothetical protein